MFYDYDTAKLHLKTLDFSDSDSEYKTEVNGVPVDFETLIAEIESIEDDIVISLRGVDEVTGDIISVDYDEGKSAFSIAVPDDANITIMRAFYTILDW